MTSSNGSWYIISEYLPQQWFLPCLNHLGVTWSQLAYENAQPGALWKWNKICQICELHGSHSLLVVYAAVLYPSVHPFAFISAIDGWICMSGRKLERTTYLIFHTTSIISSLDITLDNYSFGYNFVVIISRLAGQNIGLCLNIQRSTQKGGGGRRCLKGLNRSGGKYYQTKYCSKNILL